MGSSSIRMENTCKTVYLRVYEFRIYVTNYVIKIAFIKWLHDTHKIIKIYFKGSSIVSELTIKENFIFSDLSP